MAYQEVTTTGYGTRVGRSFRGIGTGFMLFLAATALLWWNEGRAVKTDKMLNEVGKDYVVMENPNKRDAQFDGELVCATAVATTEDSLSDAQFGIGAKAIALTRKVEYYQWVEHSSEESEDKLGGKEVTTTTYTYSKEWVDEPVQSADFKDPKYQGKNTVRTTVKPNEVWAETVTFGAYTLNDYLKERISSTEPMSLEGIEGDSLRHVNGNVLYYGVNEAAPEIGDVRVTFEKVVPAKVTVFAQVDGETFKAYKTKSGKRYQRLVMGKRDAEEILESEHAANSMWLWILRLVGIMLVISGLKGIFGILETLLKVVPFLANIFGWGVGVVCTVVGIVWSLIVIALAWLFYRPLIGVSLLVVAGGLIWFFAFRGKGKDVPAVPEAADAAGGGEAKE